MPGTVLGKEDTIIKKTRKALSSNRASIKGKENTGSKMGTSWDVRVNFESLPHGFIVSCYSKPRKATKDIRVRKWLGRLSTCHIRLMTWVWIPRTRAKSDTVANACDPRMLPGQLAFTHSMGKQEALSQTKVEGEDELGVVLCTLHLLCGLCASIFTYTRMCVWTHNE